ncbi:hypothetical protein BU24DRAFT_420693 [Aaosphaeria arxii CBS 175.79]|uniref:Uncharacterized protein n=1 Tax=Aaosphaeria arxii CBS 175.79 TaxID=1450172 RepID=A0A6A5XWW5_9PLEO|nr:uncharacterized protein BU24DRAFT_420693 [Aaosphaeria arxii CBS 175.79]KAF2017652.1 hypothetical protein BU24DRAFT_420693 [Aaosphaeria arxii CBS 175.79]
MTLSPKVKSNSTRHYKAIGRDLYNIIVKAGIISLIMRCDPHTIYHFPHSFKETVFDGRTMEVVNFEDMQAEDPRSRKSWPQGYTKDDKDTARNYSPLTQIILMDGIEAYRRGGWETADSTRWSPEYAQGTENEGFRVRRIVPAWTYLRWGKPRRFERGVEIANEKIHGKDWNGGFVEFQDVEGVPKPRPVVENDGDSS